MIVHSGANTFLDRERGDGTPSPKMLNSEQVDLVQWARASKAAGTKSLILVAEHHEGFSLYRAAESEYSVENRPRLSIKSDLVKITNEAVRKEGMGLGIYLSPRDRYEPKYAAPKACATSCAAAISSGPRPPARVTPPRWSCSSRSM